MSGAAQSTVPAPAPAPAPTPVPVPKSASAQAKVSIFQDFLRKIKSQNQKK
jgi:hypothetical protein